MSRPKPKILLEYANKENFKIEQILDSEAIWAVFYKEQPFNLKSGSLVRLPCLICGNESEAHHPDYSRPLDVVWLCSSHHKEAHKIK